MTQHIAIVTPVLDDWDTFCALVAEIAERYSGGEMVFHIVAVDDGSCGSAPVESVPLPSYSCIVEVEILRLAVNMGHQRAIAVGLTAIAERDDIDCVIVMDSDGEDRPSDIAALVAESLRAPDHAIMARRVERSEGTLFKVCYVVYKRLFQMATGKLITFGNFSLLPMSVVRRLVYMPHLWNNLAAAVMRSRVPYTTVPTARGSRYAGRSKMNLNSLVLHGLSAMSVFTDVIFVRVMLVTAMVAALSVLGICAATIIRLTTDLAIPGWATTAVGSLMIILLQTIVIAVASTLMMLAGRSNRPIVPMTDAPVYIARRDTLSPRGASPVVDLGASLISR